jgi:UDP-glucose 6-dehydrogenase
MPIRPRPTVVGTGYLGATHAASMAELGYDVLGIDVDENKIAALPAGELPFFEPELEPLLREHLESGGLRFTTSYQEAADFSDVHFVCVGTPQQADTATADLRFGGGCLPKDTRALMTRAAEPGADKALRFLREVDAINMRRRARVAHMTNELIGGSVLGKRVAVLGTAFKPNTDDVRDAPALNVAMTLQLQGAAVSVYDPEAMVSAKACPRHWLTRNRQ